MYCHCIENKLKEENEQLAVSQSFLFFLFRGRWGGVLFRRMLIRLMGGIA